MLKPELPPDELERLRMLRDMLVLDTEPEERFDSITAFCCTAFRVPISLVTLVDAQRQWFKSCQGLDLRETSRDISFCAHAILQDEPLIVADARTDLRFADNPLVTGDPQICFYAGMPLSLRSGHRVGSLCLIDRKPRRLEPEEIALLRDLARLVATELEA